MEFITQEIITLALAIFGSLGTLITWFFGWYKSRKKLSAQIVKYTVMESIFVAYVILNNKSSAPLIINSVALTFNEANYPCYEIPKKIFENTNIKGNEIVSSHEYYSVQFPINLAPSYGTSCYLAFDIPQGILATLSTHVTLSVASNRGKAFQIQLKLENNVYWNKMY